MPSTRERSPAKGADEARRGKGETFGGVDYFDSSKRELYEQARRLGIAGRSQMDKKELARSIARKRLNGPLEAITGRRTQNCRRVPSGPCARGACFGLLFA